MKTNSVRVLEEIAFFRPFTATLLLSALTCLPVSSLAGNPLPQVKVLAPDSQALAGTSTGSFTVLRDSGTNNSLTIDLVFGGTAINGTDYESLPAKLTIPVGLFAVDLPLHPLNANLSATNRTVVLSVKTNSSYGADPRKNATVTIVYDLFNIHPPAVAVVAPTNGAVVRGPVVDFLADAVDSQERVASVSFFVGDSLVGVVDRPPYGLKWTNHVGTHRYTVFAKATDSLGQVALSEPVSFTMTNTFATVALTTPRDGSVLLPGIVTLAAEVSGDADPISAVGFYANGRLLGKSSKAPYSWTWINVVPGKYTLAAKALDTVGVVGESPGSHLLVSNAAPVVVITAPASGGSFDITSPITVTAQASATGASVKKVDFYVDRRLAGSATKPPYGLSLGKLTRGNHTLTAHVIDGFGMAADSAAIQISITNVSPTVKLTSPLVGATLTLPGVITLSADVKAGDGAITKVNFWSDNHLIAALTNAPYTARWTNPPVGQHIIDVHVQDTTGVVVLSDPVLLTINPHP